MIEHFVFSLKILGGLDCSTLSDLNMKQLQQAFYLEGAGEVFHQNEISCRYDNVIEVSQNNLHVSLDLFLGESNVGIQKRPVVKFKN